MAGTLIVSNLTTDTDNTFIVRSNTGTTLFSANTTGIDVANSIGATAITNDKILSVANTKISGLVTASQIASVNATTATSGTLPTARLPAGTVLQVTSNTKTDTFSSATTGSWLDVTGLSLSITPSSASSKIMVFGRITGMGTNGLTRMQMRLVRDSTAISVGDAAGSRLQVSGNEMYVADTDSFLGSTIFFLDSPATTSATTYKIQIRNGNASGSVYVNRTPSDNDTGAFPRATSSITVMEIAA
jgi:hypothetical protein